MAVAAVAFQPIYEPVQLVGAMMGAWGAVQQPLLYQIKGRPAFAFVDVYLQPGKQVIADGGSMIWMDGGVPMQTGIPGGCCAGCKRSCAGESCCQNTFNGPGKVSFGYDLPGDMMPFGVTENEAWILTAKAFVAGSANIHVDSRFTGCTACCCGREGSFFTLVKCTPGTGPGLFFAAGFGAVVRNDVAAGQSLYISPGLFFAAHHQTALEVSTPGGCISFCYGQQGFVMKFTGPGVVYTQSRDPTVMRRWGSQKQKQKKKKGAQGNVSVQLG